MYSKKANYVLVGCFVLSMTLASFVSIAILAGRTGPTDRYFLTMDNVADIKYGTQVRFEGFAVGQIEQIEPAEPGADGRFRVEISVAEGWRIPADSVTRIGSSSFLAAKTLDIESGRATEAVPKGGRIASAAPDDMFTTMRVAANRLTALSEGSVKPLLGTLQSLVSTIDRDTPQITAEFAAFARRLNTSLAPIQDILNDENVQSVRQILANSESTTQTLSGASRDLAVAMGNLQNLTGNIDGLVESNNASAEQTLKDLQYTLASVSRSVDTIVHNFDGTARNMNEFSRLIRNNPGVLLDSSPREAVSEAKASSPARKPESAQ